MNHQERAGQSLLLSFPGSEPTDELRTALARTRAAGVILFGANIVGPGQLAALCATLQSWAAAEGLPPLLIGIDQEGGTVSRLPAPFVTPPSQLAQAATGDPADVYACALLTGRQLRGCGVNLNFAPVADVNSNPQNPVIGIRAFGSDPGTVATAVEAALRGYGEARVIACVKHFPGHGDTRIDSHLGLPVVERDAAELAARELVPFVAAVAAGAPAIMSAHIVFPALDPRPATLAPPLLRGLLREHLGFAGLVFSDALNMGAIGERYGPAEATTLALEAGVDLALPLGTLASQVAVAAAVAVAYADGRLQPADAAATARRLAALRAAYAPGDGSAAAAPTAEELATYELVARDVARRGMAVCDRAGVLPIAPATRLAVVECRQARFNNAEEAVERSRLLRQLVAGAFPRAVCLSVSEAVDEAEIAAALAVAAKAEGTVLLTRNAALLPAQARLAAALAATPAQLLHVAARSPEDAGLLPRAAGSICLYGDPPVSLLALVDALRGHQGA